MSAVIAIVIVVLLLVFIGVILFFTWNWWKRTFSRLFGTTTFNNTVIPDAVWDPPIFQQLDPTTLERPVNNNSNNSLGITPIVPIFSHDWFHHPHESFPRSNIQYIKILGTGWFGKVIEADAKGIGQVIVKQMRDDANDGEQMRFLDQCRLHRDIDHPNILKLLGFAVDSQPYIFIFERLDIDLKSYLMRNKNELGLLIRPMARDIAVGLQKMFQTGFLHQDLSTRNCLVTSQNRIKIGDYGLSKQKYPRDYYRDIPIRWLSPETFDTVTKTVKEMTPESNIWSFGICLYELYTYGNIPYSSLTDEQVIERVLLTRTYVIEPVESCDVYELMVACWNSVPENRVHIENVLEILK